MTTSTPVGASNRPRKSRVARGPLCIFQFAAINTSGSYEDSEPAPAAKQQHVAGASKKTVWYAIAANACVAVVKGIAGALTGSSALLAEAAHSVADTANQGMLRASLSLSERSPDEEHPFGYGKEQFFWTLIASIVIFLAGAIFAVGHGTLTLLRPPAKQESFTLVYATIAFAFVAEGISLWRAASQTRREVREAGVPLVAHVRRSKDPTVKTVLSEDTAAIVGLLIALVGTVLAQATGKSAFDGGAAIAVGILLMVVAVLVGRDTRGLLIGEAAPREERERLRAVISGRNGVDSVRELLTMYVGPESLLVAARIDLADGLSASDVETLADEIDRDLRSAVPTVDEVFLDPTARKE
jgi:cation diffusion facilitator family transporter